MEEKSRTSAFPNFCERPMILKAGICGSSSAGSGRASQNCLNSFRANEWLLREDRTSLHPDVARGHGACACDSEGGNSFASLP